MDLAVNQNLDNKLTVVAASGLEDSHSHFNPHTSVAKYGKLRLSRSHQIKFIGLQI
jgi:hypothetical protein